MHNHSLYAYVWISILGRDWTGRICHGSHQPCWCSSGSALKGRCSAGCREEDHVQGVHTKPIKIVHSREIWKCFGITWNHEPWAQDHSPKILEATRHNANHSTSEHFNFQCLCILVRVASRNNVSYASRHGSGFNNLMWCSQAVVVSILLCMHVWLVSSSALQWRHCIIALHIWHDFCHEFTLCCLYCFPTLFFCVDRTIMGTKPVLFSHLGLTRPFPELLFPRLLSK